MGRKPKNPIQEWRDKNPLRVARKARGLTTDAVAAVLGVSSGLTVLYWEIGRRTPNAKFMAGISALMGESMLDVIRAWKAWLNDRPE